MSETETETEGLPTAMVLANESASLADLADLGFITPIATPSRLRAAFAEKQRLYAAILEKAVGVGIGSADADEVDSLNILEATRLAMRRAVDNLVPSPDYLLIDAVTLS